ncbi:MAG TPA: low temperature requirement protein A [Acidimicrobiia bacterium]|jgi:low temperature requirement protein LtrA
MTDAPASSMGLDRAASTLELFFDLVFVLAVTQVVAIFEETHSAAGTLRGAMLLMMFWWTWGLFTWTTNWTGTDTLLIRLTLLAAMAGLLLLAGAVPEAYTTAGAWLGGAYLAVRYTAALVYFLGVRESPQQRAALLTFLPFAMVPPLVVLAGGLVDDPARTVLWLASIAVDLVAAALAGRGEWHVAARHFAERHGLFVIIALGESIIAIGVSAVGTPRTLVQAAALVVSFVIAAALFWSYFHGAAPAAERKLDALVGKQRGRFARDFYTILHFPIVLGIVLFAVASEEIVAHPSDPLSGYGRFAIVVGTSLVLVSLAVGLHHATTRLPLDRLVAVLVIAAAALATQAAPGLVTAIVVAVVVIAALVGEERRRIVVD